MSMARWKEQSKEDSGHTLAAKSCECALPWVERMPPGIAVGFFYGGGELVPSKCEYDFLNLHYKV